MLRRKSMTILVPFRGFNECAPMQMRHRNLPHWRQDGCSYFVTFRLADSIPRGLIEQWEDERTTWCKAWNLDSNLPPDEYRARYLSIPETIRLTFEREQTRKPLMELDKCHGSCIFRNQQNAETLRDALLYFDGSRLQCGDFVIMPNHVHWIVMPLPGFELGALLKSVKGYVSRALGKMDDQLKGSLWQSETYDRCIRDREELVKTRDYVRRNPEVAKVKDGNFIHYRADWLDQVE